VTDQELLDEVRRRRAAGASPKDIARSLGVRRAQVEPLVRRLAAEAPAPAQDELVGCWIIPGWSRDLLVRSREGWDDVDLGRAGPGGVALVLVARAGRRDDRSAWSAPNVLLTSPKRPVPVAWAPPIADAASLVTWSGSGAV